MEGIKFSGALKGEVLSRLEKEPEQKMASSELRGIPLSGHLDQLAFQVETHVISLERVDLIRKTEPE